MVLAVNIILIVLVLIGLASEIALSIRISDLVNDVNFRKQEAKVFNMREKDPGIDQTQRTNNILQKELSEKRIETSKNIRKIIGIFICIILFALMLLNSFSFLITFFIGMCLIIWVCCWIIGLFND